MEFFFPTHSAATGDQNSVQGCITGFIDLIFRRNGKYYLLDWKSNYLREGYSSEHVEEAMSEAGYHLQYQIYSIALCRWLRTVIPDFDQDEHFGGTFYLFLRGTRAGDSVGGIFRHASTGADIAQWNVDLGTRFK